MSGQRSAVSRQTRMAFSHDRSENTKHEWLTPLWLIEALGKFDLDPCAPVPEIRPWDTADKHHDIRADGLIQFWSGRVWCNPPYENEIAGAFLAKCAQHGNAMALIYARTETANWFDYIWPKADALLFIKGRLTFWETQCAACGIGGSKHTEKFQCKAYAPSNRAVAGGSAGAPSVLVAYGQANAEVLRACKIPGHYIDLCHGHPAINGKR